MLVGQARELALASLTVALAFIACGGMPAAGSGDAGFVNPDGQGASGAPLVPCSGSGAATSGGGRYACGTCGTDGFYPVVCKSGYLACPTSYVGSAGTTVEVPAGEYVVDMDDYENMTGQCAYVQTYYYPGFALADPPQALTTARDPALPLALRAVSSGHSAPTFGTLLQDRAQGENAIRSLVTLTDMTNSAPVAFTIGDPVRDNTTYVETLALTPVTPLATNGWYRVTINPAETQQFVNCHTFGRISGVWLTAPETTDFYTYSRPMVEEMFVAYKDGSKGYLDFLFTEPLSVGELASYPMAAVAVDGAALSGCLTPYSCSGSSAQQVYDLRLDLQVVPTSFTEITLRIPHAIKSVNGGTILDGTTGNLHVAVDGDWAVYTFKAADMILTDNNAVERWYYAGE
jgi:hypothetical protein